jgi:hypothetical protein
MGEPSERFLKIVAGLRKGNGCAHGVMPYDDDPVHQAYYAASDFEAEVASLKARLAEAERLIRHWTAEKGECQYGDGGCPPGTPVGDECAYCCGRRFLGDKEGGT